MAEDQIGRIIEHGTLEPPVIEQETAWLDQVVRRISTPLIDAKGIRCCYHKWLFAADGFLRIWFA